MFIKHGDGKINHIVESEELTEEQKQALKKASDQVVELQNEESKNEKLEN